MSDNINKNDSNVTIKEEQKSQEINLEQEVLYQFKLLRDKGFEIDTSNVNLVLKTLGKKMDYDLENFIIQNVTKDFYRLNYLEKSNIKHIYIQQNFNSPKSFKNIKVQSLVFLEEEQKTSYVDYQKVKEDQEDNKNKREEDLSQKNKKPYPTSYQQQEKMDQVHSINRQQTQNKESKEEELKARINKSFYFSLLKFDQNLMELIEQYSKQEAAKQQEKELKGLESEEQTLMFKFKKRQFRLNIYYAIKQKFLQDLEKNYQLLKKIDIEKMEIWHEFSYAILQKYRLNSLKEREIKEENKNIKRTYKYFKNYYEKIFEEEFQHQHKVEKELNKELLFKRINKHLDSIKNYTNV